MINHLILPSGGYNGFAILGVLISLIKKKYIDISNLKSIFGTSVGSLIGVLLILKIDINDIEEYFINKPSNSFKSSIKLKRIYKSGGLINKNFFIETFESLFKCCDLNIKNTTLKQLYDWNNIDLYIYSYCKSDNKTVSFSHYTHPNMLLLTAIHASCSIPIIFEPVKYKKKIYVDGVISNNLCLIDICIDKYDLKK